MSETRSRPRRKPKRRLWIVLISVASVLLLAAGAVTAYGLSLSHTFNKTEKIPQAFPKESDRPAPLIGEAAKAQNILLLGSDTRGSVGGDLNDIRGQRSDTMMIVHIPADRKGVQVMSVMRDSWVTIAGHGDAKINAALSYGGMPLVVQTLESLIGVRIDHVAIVDFQGFKGITNALGGVTVNNPIAFDSGNVKGYQFAQGPIKLNGAEALAYVRERYAFSDGDYQRVRNQQLYLKAVLGAVLSTDTLTNPVKISNLVGAIVPYLTVDKGFDSAYVSGLAVEMRNVRMGDVRFFTLPTTGTGMIGDQSVVLLDDDQVALVKKAFQTDTLDEYQPPAGK